MRRFRSRRRQAPLWQLLYDTCVHSREDGRERGREVSGCWSRHKQYWHFYANNGRRVKLPRTGLLLLTAVRSYTAVEDTPGILYCIDGPNELFLDLRGTGKMTITASAPRSQQPGAAGLWHDTFSNNNCIARRRPSYNTTRSKRGSSGTADRLPLRYP